ncbi:MAG: BrnT family toxin [Deltaproteobacteria bacterium]|nr:BrnT family toxin [Deltaproteobacteria bacterium]
MEVQSIIWLDVFVEKIWRKHHVHMEEVEEVLYGSPRIRRVARGDVAGEDVYSATGQTTGGRYLIIFFVLKVGARALVISARDIKPKERRQYVKK